MGSWASVSSVTANDLPRDKWRRLALFAPPDLTSHAISITPQEPIGLNVQGSGFYYLSTTADGQEVAFRSRVIPTPAPGVQSIALSLSITPQLRFPEWTGPWFVNVSLPRWFPETVVAVFRYIP